MKIPLTLNEKKAVIDAEPSETLLAVLRRNNLTGVKCGCEEGQCGSCMILLDGKMTPSCVLHAGMVRDAHIVTLEHFKTYPEYADIQAGFAQAGVHLCGWCDAGKLFTAYEVMQHAALPGKDELYEAIDGLTPCCVDRDTLANGILYAIASMQRREGKKSHGKK